MFKTSKYSPRVNQELEIRVLDILAHSEESLSIQQIQQSDIILSKHTSQKITRILSKLIEMGFVRKGKSKSTNRMMYKAVSVMIAQGYDIIDEANVNATPAVAPMAVTPNWELIEERKFV